MIVDIKQNEDNFQKAINHWVEYHDDESWKEMFSCVLTACTNLTLSIYKKRGFKHFDDPTLVDTKALDATLTCMRNIKERSHWPNPLSAYCYTRCLEQVNKRDKQAALNKQILELNGHRCFNNFIHEELDYE